MGIHPDYPFAHLYRIENAYMPEEVLCFLWYLCSIYTIGITFDIQWLYQYINMQFTNSQRGHKECLSTFLTWFAPLSVLNGMLRKSAKAIGLSFKKLKSQGGLNHFFNLHKIYFFHRLVQVNKKTGKVHALPTLIHHNDYQRGVRPDFNLNGSKPVEDFQTHAFRLNSATQSFPIPFVPNWFYYPIDYQMSLDEDLQFYLDKSDKPPMVKHAPKKEKRNSESQECPPEYFQDAQLPDDSMNIDEVGRIFNIDINGDSQQPQEEEPENVYEYPGDVFECPDDHYRCCEKHIIEFEMDH
ncbi:unnamed protein product [Brassica rapa subsp. trilocularis]